MEVIEFEFIRGFENYLITSDGKVFSIDTDKFSKPRLRGKKTTQYYCVCLYNQKKKQNISVHKLVADAFLEKH